MTLSLVKYALGLFQPSIALRMTQKLLLHMRMDEKLFYS